MKTHEMELVKRLDGVTVTIVVEFPAGQEVLAGELVDEGAMVAVNTLKKIQHKRLNIEEL